MPVVPLKEIVDRAFAERYGVAAINVVNDLTMEAVLAAAVEQRAPVIIQTSVKTVRSIGIDQLFAMWRAMTAGIEVPVTLHLDHCPDRAVHQRLPAPGLELGPVRRFPAAGGGEPAADRRHRGRGAVGRRQRRGRDRGDHRRRGRHRLRRGGGPRVAAGRARLHPHDRDRRVRTRDRQRARRLPVRAEAGRAAGVRHRGRRADPDRPARWHRDDRCPVHRPDRARLRQGEHLHRAEDHLHEVQPRVP